MQEGRGGEAGGIEGGALLDVLVAFVFLILLRRACSAAPLIPQDRHDGNRYRRRLRTDCICLKNECHLCTIYRAILMQDH